MTLTTAILLNAILDFGIVVALAAAMLIPFTLDRGAREPRIYSFAAPLPEELAA